MNDTSHTSPHSEPAGPEGLASGLDADLAQLFDRQAHMSLDADAFVSTTLLKIQRFQRARLLRRSLTLALIMVLSAFAAPYIAQATLIAADWVAERWPAAGVTFIAPAVSLSAALVAWRLAHRARPGWR